MNFTIDITPHWENLKKVFLHQIAEAQAKKAKAELTKAMIEGGSISILNMHMNGRPLPMSEFNYYLLQILKGLEVTIAEAEAAIHNFSTAVAEIDNPGTQYQEEDEEREWNS